MSNSNSAATVGIDASQMSADGSDQQTDKVTINSWDLANLTAPPFLRGAIESIRDDGIIGWCIDTRDVGRPITLTIMFLGVEIGKTAANGPRGDIEAILGQPSTAAFHFLWRSSKVADQELETLLSAVENDPDSPADIAIKASAAFVELQMIPNSRRALTNAEVFNYILTTVARKQQPSSNQSFEVERENILKRYANASALGLDKSNASESDNVKLIAFYLPQFHPIPENDQWWGPGFTEWTNVSSAKPLFPDHEQPNLPADLGFYDLRLGEVREKQAALAREYGVYGFCYYYYWFSGRRILERPLNDLLSSGTPDFPFCVCWANESWSRRWDGSESEVLIGQTHDLDTDVTLIDELIPMFEDSRYIRINGRPLLIIYRVSLLPEPRELFERWREICAVRGVEPPHICMAETFGLHGPYEYGCDSAVEFPPHKTSSPVINVNVDGLPENYTGNIYDYNLVVHNDLHGTQPSYPRFRTVMTSWDNTSRRGKSGNIFLNATPELYEIWLRGVIDWTRSTRIKGEQFVFINAWNEWAEGAFLEPSRRHGRAYLEATRRAFTDTSDWRQVLLEAEQDGEISPEKLPLLIERLRRLFSAYERSNNYLSKRLSSKDILWGLSLATLVKPFLVGSRPVVPAAKVSIERIGPFPATLHVVHRRNTALALVGWSACSGFPLQQDTVTYLTLTSLANPEQIWYVPVYYRIRRGDVVENSDMSSGDALWSGFELTVVVSDMPAGSYWIGFDLPGSSAIYRGYSALELTFV